MSDCSLAGSSKEYQTTCKVMSTTKELNFVRSALCLTKEFKPLEGTPALLRDITVLERCNVFAHVLSVHVPGCHIITKL